MLAVFSFLLILALPLSANAAPTTTEAASDPYAPTSESITRLSYEIAKLQDSINLLSQQQRELKAEIEEVDESSVGWYTIFCVCWIGFMVIMMSDVAHVLTPTPPAVTKNSGLERCYCLTSKRMLLKAGVHWAAAE